MPTRLPNEHNVRPQGSMQLDPTGEVGDEETVRLIASSKVEGTPVFNAAGEELGTVHNFMVDKYTGQVAYVVMLSGSFLGLGGSYHPLPWKALKYDPRVGGYVIDADQTRLMNAPKYEGEEDPFADPAFGGKVDEHYA